MGWVFFFIFKNLVFLEEEKKSGFFNIHISFLGVLGVSSTSDRYAERKVNPSLYNKIKNHELTMEKELNWIPRASLLDQENKTNLSKPENTTSLNARTSTKTDLPRLQNWPLKPYYKASMLTFLALKALYNSVLQMISV